MVGEEGRVGWVRKGRMGKERWDGQQRVGWGMKFGMTEEWRDG